MNVKFAGKPTTYPTSTTYNKQQLAQHVARSRKSTRIVDNFYPFTIYHVARK
jgi:hypothetical protein